MSSPLQYFDYKNKTLCCDGVPLARIAETVGTPAYVYSAAGFMEPLRELQRGLKGLDATICYAVKANSTVAILQLLARAGAGADLVSGGELYRAGLAGVPASRIVFSGVGKTRAEIEQALAYQGTGIFAFNVESVSELEMIDGIAQGLGRKAHVALRFNPDVDARTHPYISTGLKKNKFGLNRGEILGIARRIRARPMPGVAFQGLSIHIGSQLLSLSPVRDAFRLTRELIDELTKILPEPLTSVDLGGGVGIAYRNEKTPSLSRYCELIHRNFKSLPLRILLEPGRILAGNSGVLLTTVLHRKVRKAKDFLVIDAGMNDLMRPALYGSHHGIVPVDQAFEKGAKRRTDIVGPVCESSDCFATDRSLSGKLAQRDLLAILSAGAYGFSMAGNYNSRPRPAEVLVEDGRFQVIRERETYADLVRGEKVDSPAPRNP